MYITESLLRIYENIFLLVKKKDDLCQPGPPFFHLRSSGFWFHKVRPERVQDYQKLSTSGGGLQIIEDHIEYAYLRQDVYDLIKDPITRNELRIFISNLLNSQKES
jgi:hypothetical protein